MNDTLKDAYNHSKWLSDALDAVLTSIVVPKLANPWVGWHLFFNHTRITNFGEALTFQSTGEHPTFFV